MARHTKVCESAMYTRKEFYAAITLGDAQLREAMVAGQNRLEDAMNARFIRLEDAMIAGDAQLRETIAAGDAQLREMIAAGDARHEAQMADIRSQMRAERLWTIGTVIAAALAIAGLIVRMGVG